jgi:hypothetical protein
VSLELAVLSDRQWAEIASTVDGLPSEARDLIERQVWFFQQSRGHRARSEIIADLQEIEAQAAALSKSLNELPLDVLWALTDAGGNSPTVRRDAPILLEKKKRNIEEMRKWAFTAQARYPKQHRSPSKNPDNLRALVSGLDAILFEFTGKHVTRSEKRGSSLFFVRLVVRAAEPSVGDGSIDEAIKRLRYYGENGRSLAV